MSDEHDILIDATGAHFVYSDTLAEVFEGESQETTRASHVEPYRGGWKADMSPSGGPQLFRDGACDGDACQHHVPFPTRQAALDAERQWLREHKGL